MKTNKTPRTQEMKSETIRLPASVFKHLMGPDRHDTIEAMKKSKCRYEEVPPRLREGKLSEGSIIIEARTQERIEDGKKIFNDLAARLRAEENAPAQNNQVAGQHEIKMSAAARNDQVPVQHESNLPAQNNRWRTFKRVTEQYQMPAKYAGYIIGYRREKIQKISSDTGATIKADYLRTNGVTNRDVTVFTVTGAREQVTECLEVIKGMKMEQLLRVHFPDDYPPLPIIR